jgi:S1-C subfamily serine protease
MAIAGTPAGLGAAPRPEKIYQKTLPSVMTLEVEDVAGEKFVGTGVLALADDVAVTAWHVIAGARSVCAVFADGQRIEVSGCIDRDGVRDLALIKLAKALPHRRAALCTNLQPVAARTYVIGSPKGYDFSISDGLISQIRRVDGFPQYQLSCPISAGNSGSPVLNERGQVIGIASWTKADAQNVSFAIPTGELARLNLSHPWSTWAQVAASPPPSLPARAVESRPVSDKVLKDAAGNRRVWPFSELKKARTSKS